jgi:hypothetical protein
MEILDIDKKWYHASPAKFDRFKITSDIGFHFGTKRQALNRMKYRKIKNFYLYEISLLSGNFFRTNDKKVWLGKGLEEILSEASLPIGEQTEMITLLHTHFDGIVYQNGYEDSKRNGSDSIIVFDANNINIVDVVVDKIPTRLK